MAAIVPTRDHMFAQPSSVAPDQAPVAALSARPEGEPSEISLPMVHISSSGKDLRASTVWLNVLRKAATADELV
jgi:hypothetical protein